MVASACLVRHGATEWSVSGQHTSITDLPLLESGVADAVDLAPRLAEQTWAEVLTSGLQRASRTAELAGFEDAEVCEDLVEWRYGDYEGLTTKQIREDVPGWTVWRDGCPGGEQAVDVGRRCDRVVERIRRAHGPVLVFAHGHLLRVLAARWLGLEANEGQLFRLDTGRLSDLGYERETPVLLRWNA